jgi:CDP-diacylglycerol--glycerol-3-phosphate 3-phosphatidyltransferase
MRQKGNLLTLPNTLSFSRILAVPLLFYLAWTGQSRLFLLALFCSLMTDALDGFLARKGKQASQLGAHLDSWGDFAIYATLPICAWWLWPDLIRQEAFLVIVAMASYLIPVVVGFVKFGRLTSYHTWGAKLTGVFMSAGVLLLFALGMAWPFRIAAMVLALSALEEIAMTIILEQWQPNIPTVWHAIRFARQQDTNI